MIPWFEPPALLGLDLDAVLAVGGVLLAMGWARRRADEAGVPPRRIVDGLALILVLALLLGHVLDVLLYRPAELVADWTVILPWHGGYCSLGAALGFVLAVALGFRAPGGGLRWGDLDALVPSLVLGLVPLRIGCFVGHHHAGRLSDFVLAVGFPGGARHDLGLYEALLAMAVFAGVWVVERRARLAQGAVALGATGAYAAGRFFLEFLRGQDLETLGRHSDPRCLGMTWVQAAALVAVVVVCGVWALRRRPQREGPR
ncbi:MAG: prolipoprotein diacylglyceryl transferase [Myxococcales bacterium]